MAQTRRYRLLCPIARALDRVGDRWTLLILRDLHAGPARFSDLANGLAGLATNLLTSRLQQLIEDGLARRRDAPLGGAVYELTDLGRETGAALFELARLGARFAPDADLRAPGDRRSIAVTLAEAVARVAPDDLDLVVEFVVDEEVFTLTARRGAAEMRAEPAESCDARVTTRYPTLIALLDGRAAWSDPVEGVRIESANAPKARAFSALMAAALARLGPEDGRK